MAANLPDGSIVSIATTYDAAKPITAISNANPAVATAAAHGFANGDLIEIKSGWQKINERIVRVASSTAGAFNIEGINTTSTSDFPVGSATPASARLISGWTQISQILSFEMSGGDQQFATYSFLEEDFERQLPTVTSARSIKIGIADDPNLAGFQALKAVGGTKTNRALRVALPNGSVLLYNGIVSFNETPTLQKGNVMQVTATFSLQGVPTRY